MKKLLSFVLLVFSLNIGAQNLVPNPSFEINVGCPMWAGELYYCTPWFQPLMYMGNNVTLSSSTDFFDPCSTNPVLSTPNNIGGHQFARTGTAYIGFATFYPTNNNWREYLEVELLSSLISNETYCVEYYVSLSDTCRTAISNIGVYFSNDSLVYDSTSAWRIPVIPQIINPSTNIITDKENWVKITGSFIAQGGERFMTIGNFTDSAAVTYTNVPTSGAGTTVISAYYIDDISVYRCADTIVVPEPVTENYLYVPNAFSPNNDGNNDILFVRGKNIQELNFVVYDRWGQRVFQTNDINVGWDGQYAGKEMENAVFVYYLTLTYTDGKTEVKKGNISLIR